MTASGERDGLGVTSDGSPVAVYLAAPPDDAPEVVVAVAPPPATLLELGCGAGRTTRPLVGLGYAVTAIDESPAMLAHVTGAETVAADLATLDLGRRFDVVLGASHFVDDADQAARAALLASCARHVAADGVVLLERYEPAWVADPTTVEADVGPVRIRLASHGRDADGGLRASLTYRLPLGEWTQRFRCVAATEELVAAEAADHGLVLVDVAGDDATWLVLRPG